MKSALLSVPVIGVLGKILPVKKSKGVGSLLALRFLPGWAIVVALAGFAWSLRSRARARREAEVGSDVY